MVKMFLPPYQNEVSMSITSKVVAGTDTNRQTQTLRKHYQPHTREVIISLTSMLGKNTLNFSNGKGSS